MKRSLLLSLLAVLSWLLASPAFTSEADDDSYSKQRAVMVKEVEEDLQSTAEHTGKKSLDPCVLEAMIRVPRHEFVPAHLKPFAYVNRPLPIGHSQTISQPFIVGIMTELLNIRKGSSVLEVGTGSGYQAAVLACCANKVYSIEIIKELGEEARSRLQRLGYLNVEVRIGDGYQGWKEHAPFDAIMVTAAPDHIPPPLIEQLKPGGRMVIPVGRPGRTQYLTLVEKDADGKVTTRQLLPVAFVPLTD